MTKQKTHFELTVRAALKAKGRKLTWLARRKLGISTETLYNWFRDPRLIKPAYRKYIPMVLGVAESELFKGVDYEE